MHEHEILVRVVVEDVILNYLLCNTIIEKLCFLCYKICFYVGIHLNLGDPPQSSLDAHIIIQLFDLASFYIPRFYCTRVAKHSDLGKTFYVLEMADT